jgi:hypothetical protein
MGIDFLRAVDARKDPTKTIEISKGGRQPVMLVKSG